MHPGQSGERRFHCEFTPAGSGRPPWIKPAVTVMGGACPGHPERQSASTDGRAKPGHDGVSEANSEPGSVLGVQRRANLHRSA
jgi:hypothetical protein